MTQLLYILTYSYTRNATKQLELTISKKTLDYGNVLVIDQTIRWSKMIIQLGCILHNFLNKFYLNRAFVSTTFIK